MPFDAVLTDIRVRYAECDPMQVAHHSVYPIWFELGRSEFCRVRGISYSQMERDGLFLPIVELRIRYVAPARYDDLVTLETRVTEVRRRTLRTQYTLRRVETRLAEGETYQILVDDAGRPRSWPTDIGKLFGFTSE